MLWFDRLRHCVHRLRLSSCWGNGAFHKGFGHHRADSLASENEISNDRRNPLAWRAGAWSEIGVDAPAAVAPCPARSALLRGASGGDRGNQM
ncbi:hypothetical protein GCM10022402_19320 [Salinactinospora qingdaonensis]|uniref:Uncharacterized protein n=1 Tax=Salinactinospora qingdaonensis TaxID=702744 RepID=A0ABP7FMT7_9ACTN